MVKYKNFTTATYALLGYLFTVAVIGWGVDWNEPLSVIMLPLYVGFLFSVLLGWKRTDYYIVNEPMIIRGFVVYPTLMILCNVFR